MSSPSGRRKFQEIQIQRDARFSGRDQQSLGDEATGNGQEDDDDDEETLQLKLAAIEARLKLKRLQRNKARLKLSTSEVKENDSCSGTSSTAPPPRSRFLDRKKKIGDVTHQDSIQVPLSPIKCPAGTIDQVSPRRIILGIDKGIRSTDVSLRPPLTSSAALRPRSVNGSRDSVSSQMGRDITMQNTEIQSSEVLAKSNSFSQRIANSRLTDKTKRDKAVNLQRKRSAAFTFDKDELERFRAEETESNRHSSSVPLNIGHRIDGFTRDDVLQSYHQLSSGLCKSKTTSGAQERSSVLIAEREATRHLQGQKELLSAGSKSPALNEKQPDELCEGTDAKAPNSSKFEPFSAIHLSNRILPHSFLTRTFDSKALIRIPDLLKTVKAPNFDPPDTDGDYVVFGIVASKSSPRDHKEGNNVSTKNNDPDGDGLNNTRKYMVLTLTDLQWTVDLFLFATAFPRYYRLSPGTLIAILNPSIMPPPPHKTDTNNFSLTLSSSDDTVLEIGTAQDLGFCKALKKEGKMCDSWVDARKTEYCEFHVNIQLRKTQARRMEVNSGPNLLGPGGRSHSRTGTFSRGPHIRDSGLSNGCGIYDRSTGSTYYVTPKVLGAVNPHVSGRRSAASLLDSDDILIAPGALKRGGETKPERLCKRLADKERERMLVKQLGERGDVGAEYLRLQHSDTNPKPDNEAHSDNSNKSHDSRLTPSTTSARTTLGLHSGSRSASNVKLGPIKKRRLDSVESGGEAAIGKKTRFITSKGIRVAGRESFGLPSDGVDDDDDDLDIV